MVIKCKLISILNLLCVEGTVLKLGAERADNHNSVL